jgi:phosphatidylglycerol:prolipoprotein diacylglycerol transferase
MWYGIIATLAVAVLIIMSLRIAKRAGVDEDAMYLAVIWGIPGGVIGSKLLHVIDKLDYYSSYPARIFSLEGLTIWGAILGGMVAILIYTSVRNHPTGRMLDAIAPAAPLAQAIGKVGCTINGCCHGLPTTLPWAITYIHPNAYATLGTALHPTQVYEILWNLATFAIVWMLRGRLKRDGSLCLTYLAVYSIGKFLVHFLRPGTVFLFGLQQAQVVSILVLVVAAILLGRNWRQSRVC